MLIKKNLNRYYIDKNKKITTKFLNKKSIKLLLLHTFFFVSGIKNIFF